MWACVCVNKEKAQCLGFSLTLYLFISYIIVHSLGIFFMWDYAFVLKCASDVVPHGAYDSNVKSKPSIIA